MPLSRSRAELLALLIGTPILLFVFAADWVEWARLGGDSTAGRDFTLYRDATARWLSGGAFYESWQLAGPYTVVHGAILYPPPTLVLFAPFTILPAVLWWALPLGAVAGVIAYHRSRPLALLGVVFCLLYTGVAVRIVNGNPMIWAMAAVALGTVWGWPAAFVVLKPTLAPFALIGLRRRSWWIASAGLAVIALAFLPLWSDYVAVIRNARDPLGPLYSVHELPALWVPLLAWLGGRHGPSTARSTFDRSSPA